MNIRINYKNLIFFAVLCLALIGSFHVKRKFAFINHSHFTDLAFSFLQGRLSLPEPIRYSSWQDSAYFKGKYYVYFSPLPAILLIPVVAILGQNISQQILTFLAGIINFFLLFKISKTLGLKKNDGLWLVIGFIFGSIYLFLSLVNISAYLIQIVGFTFQIAALYEFFTKRRWWLIGLLFALSGMTRPSLYFTFPFFVLEIFKSRSKERKLAFFSFVFPTIISILLLGVYNQLRFGNPLDNGYTYNTTWPPGVKEAIRNGFFSFKHLPGNLYFLFFKSPEVIRISNISYVLRFPFLRANEWGLGIFFTSPFFLYLFFSDYKKKFVFSSLIASLVGLLPALLYAGVGVWQFGYRYALDIYPFLFILLASIFSKGMPRLAKTFIFYSIIFNLFLMGSIWEVYPF